MSSSKEAIKAAAKKRFQTKDIDLGEGVKVQVRELSRSDRAALDRAMFVCDDHGEPVIKDGRLTFKEDSHPCEQWLAACLIPEHSVEELLSDDWPDSLKDMLEEECRRINGKGATLASEVKP